MSKTIEFLKRFPTDKELSSWVNHRLNVMLIGVKGVGKTKCMKEAFSNSNIKYKYFSASTMDPWVDFIGVPKEVLDENGKPYLELIKPKDIRDDVYGAYIFDEFNRSKAPVKAAVMEIIQFQTLNNIPLPNLEVVWAACNPWDTEEYETDPLDMAQLDRFEVILELPSEPQQNYFIKNYDHLGSSAVTWWKSQSEPVQHFVSPRRLETVIQLFQKGVDISPTLPKEAGVKSLLKLLKQGDPIVKLQELSAKGDEVELKNFITSEENYSYIELELFSKYQKWVYLVSNENLFKMWSINRKLLKQSVQIAPQKYVSFLNTLIATNSVDFESIQWAQNLLNDSCRWYNDLPQNILNGLDYTIDPLSLTPIQTVSLWSKNISPPTGDPFTDYNMFDMTAKGTTSYFPSSYCLGPGATNKIDSILNLLYDLNKIKKEEMAKNTGVSPVYVINFTWRLNYICRNLHNTTLQQLVVKLGVGEVDLINDLFSKYLSLISTGTTKNLWQTHQGLFRLKDVNILNVI